MGLSRDNAILNMMYRGMTTVADFNWDAMTTTPILYLMTPQDIDSIKQLILSPRYSGNNKFKMEKIDEIMHYRGFKRFAGGTNRLVYTHPSAPNAVFKVAIDSVGINDNPAEFRNQNFLKPYCCKVFECSPCGTIASFEKVERITTFDEFYSIGEDYFQIIVNVILGKYVMDDIGIDFFMNFGIRAGCFPVILDFPYLFELDGRKLECNNVLDDGSICHGEIDYDAGFNKLVCKKCGRQFKARDLAKPPKEGGILLRKRGGRRMELIITDLKGNILETHDTTIERDHLSRNDPEVVKTSNKVEVIIETVHSKASEEKKEMAGHESKKTPKVVADTKSNANTYVHSHNRPSVKRKIVEIDPLAHKKASKEVKHLVELDLETVKIPATKAPETAPKYTETPKVVVEHKVETEESEKLIVGRVIEVSVGKKPTEDKIVKADTTNHFVEVVIESVKDEAKNPEALKVVIEEPKKVEEPIVEEKKPEVVEINLTDPTNNMEEAKEETTISDDVQAVAEEYQKMTQNMGQMQQAVFFGDEPGGITEEDIKAQEPNEEETVDSAEESVEDTESEEKETVTEDEQSESEEVEAESTETSDTVVPVGTTLNVKGYIEIDNREAEYDHKYINEYFKNNLKENPSIGDLVYVKHVDTDDTEHSSDYYCMYICADFSYAENAGRWQIIESDQDEIPVPAEGFTKVEIAIAEDRDPEDEATQTEESASNEEVSTEEESSNEDASEEEDEDEEDYDDIMVSDHKPTVGEIEDGTFWCVPRHSKVSAEDIDKLMTSQDCTLIDRDLFITYFKLDDEIVPITSEGDVDVSWIVDNDEGTIIELNSVIGSDGCVYEFCDELPDLDEAEPGKYYLLRLLEAEHFDVFMVKEDKAKYHFICHAVDTYADEEVSCETESPNNETPVKEEPKPTSKTDDADVEDLIKAMKASSKKINPDEFLAKG